MKKLLFIFIIVLLPTTFAISNVHITMNRTNILNPVTMVLSQITHWNISHFAENMIFIVLLIPILFAKYPENDLLTIIVVSFVVSIISSIITIIELKDVGIMGESGIAMFISGVVLVSKLPHTWNPDYMKPLEKYEVIVKFIIFMLAINYAATGIHFVNEIGGESYASFVHQAGIFSGIITGLVLRYKDKFIKAG